MDKLEKLARRAQNGEKDAFVELIEQCKLSMSRTALAILHSEEDAVDAISETVLIAFTKLCGLRQPKYFKTWLTRILIYQCYHLLRQRQKAISLDAVPEGLGEIDCGEERDNVIDIQCVLQELRENDKLILTLFYLEDLSVREIAEMLHIREDAVKTRLSRSRKRFRELYEEREARCCEACEK